MAIFRSTRVVLLSLFLVVFVAAFLLRTGDDMPDFEVDYKAGQRLRRGEDLYQPEDGHYMYKYLPGAAVLEMPFSLLPLRAAKFAFYSFVTFCLFLVLGLSYRLLPPDPAKTVWLQVLTFLILSKYLLREINLGQINLIITALLLLMVRYLAAAQEERSAGKEASAGVFWAAATVLKPYGFVFLPYLVLTRRWKAVLWGTGFCVVASVAPSLFYGLKGNLAQHRVWAETLGRSTPELLTEINNTSILGYLAKWTGSVDVAQALYLAATAALAGLMLAVVLVGRGNKRAVVLDGAMLLLLIPLLAPLGWNYMLLMSVLGVMLLLQQRSRFSPVSRGVLVANLVVIAVSISFLIGYPLYDQYKAWTLATVNFSILLGYLAALRFKGVC